MLLTSRRYEKQVRELIKCSKYPRLAVAFWGDGALGLFSRRRCRTMRIICNLRAGGTNPKVIASMQAEQGFVIRTLGNLHAKVVLGDAAAIVGSANVSSNGLGLESRAAGGWHEAGLLTEDRKELKAIGDWFERLWRIARPVTPSDLARAQATWDHRKVSIRFPKRPSARLWSPELYHAAPVYLVIWREDASEEGEAAFRKWKKKEAPQLSDRLYTWFEEWDSLPARGVLISVRYGKRGAVSIQDISRRHATVRFRNADGAWATLQVCVKTHEILDRQVSRTDLNALEKRLGRKIDAVWNDPKATGDEDGKQIPLCDALRTLV